MSAIAKRLLIAEDEPSTREALRELITSWGFEVQTAEDGRQALALIESYEPDILLLDIRLPHVDGLQILNEIKESGIEITSIVSSGQGDIPDVVKAIKLGAYDYLRKPVDLTRLKLTLHNVCELISVRRKNRRMRQQLIYSGAVGSLIAHSPAMRKVAALIEQVAASNASVIIVGESGTGKEVVARTIHELSPRANGPYLAINCAAMPEALMESELFGHEKGAFTGADRRREGCFELARGGTLLLDEITEMKVQLQAKLLRVLEERTLRRVGGNTDVPLDVRVLAASNRDLAATMEQNRLRPDLYYRLNVFTIELPPLRRRIEDIQPLIDVFLHEFSAEASKNLEGVDERCLEALKAYAWPGNVRQLRNVIRRAVAMAEGKLITLKDLPGEVRGEGIPALETKRLVGKSLDEVEREIIFDTLKIVNGNKAQAAEILGISLKTIYNRLKRYRERDERFRE